MGTTPISANGSDDDVGDTGWPAKPSYVRAPVVAVGAPAGRGNANPVVSAGVSPDNVVETV